MKSILAFLLLLIPPGLLGANEPYAGYSDDLKSIRVTTELPVATTPRSTIEASSVEAINAAKRIFSKVSFLFKTKEEVLQILGDPATISAYGIKAKPGKDKKLVYWFDSGFGGSRYTIEFARDVVVSVRVEYTN